MFMAQDICGRQHDFRAPRDDVRRRASLRKSVLEYVPVELSIIPTSYKYVRQRACPQTHQFETKENISHKLCRPFT